MTWERTAETIAATSPERVWDVLLDGRRWSGWNPGVEWMTVEGSLAPGHVVTIKPKGAPQTAFRVEAAVFARLLALVVTIGPVAALRFRWELAPVEGGTSITQSLAIAGPLAGPLLRKTAQRIVDGMPANLGRLAELARSGSG
jgi:uncharacterized protein YndB with AHSA1/START domain